MRQCGEHSRPKTLNIWEGWKGMIVVVAPAEEKSDKIGEEKSENTANEVCSVGYKDSRASTKADEE